MLLIVAYLRSEIMGSHLEALFVLEGVSRTSVTMLNVTADCTVRMKGILTTLK